MYDYRCSFWLELEWIQVITCEIDIFYLQLRKKYFHLKKMLPFSKAGFRAQYDVVYPRTYLFMFVRCRRLQLQPSINHKLCVPVSRHYLGLMYLISWLFACRRKVICTLLSSFQMARCKRHWCFTVEFQYVSITKFPSLYTKVFWLPKSNLGMIPLLYVKNFEVSYLG